MAKSINLSKFISAHVTFREGSMFRSDIDSNKALLSREINGKKILVIGGAGTIGSSYIKAILEFEPSSLVVVDTNENGLTELTRELRSRKDQYIPDEFITYPMNFGDDVFMKMYKNLSPFDIVANFAAHKHVRSEKDIYSIEAMLDNNIFKAKRFLDQMLVLPPKHFFCVSTDKATNPVNVMGASKKIMEELIFSYKDKIKISTARFANVAFSNGSLFHGYLNRIQKSQAISCPSDVKRFFVSPEESGQICLLASIAGKTGEIFFPKLDASKLILLRDITRDFFTYLGYSYVECDSEEEAKALSLKLGEGGEYPLYFFNTNTSGEKLFEEFYASEDIVDKDKFESLSIITNTENRGDLEIGTKLNKLSTLLLKSDYSKSELINCLKEILPSFQHEEKGMNLDQKM